MDQVNSSLENTHPMVVIKLVVKEPSEKRKRRQLLPTPETIKNNKDKEFLMQSELQTKFGFHCFDNRVKKANLNPPIHTIQSIA